MIQVTHFILCGGSGTRFLHLSRFGFPLESPCLKGNESLFQQAAQRPNSLGNDSIREPELTALEMSKEMVAYDLAQANQHALLIANGFNVNVSFE